MSNRAVYCPKCWVQTETVYLENHEKDTDTQWGICPNCDALVKAKYRRVARPFEQPGQFLFVLGKIEEKEAANEFQG